MLSKEWLKAFVALGSVQGNAWGAAGAGILFRDGPVIWIATAKHVIASVGASRVAALVASRGNVSARLVPVGQLQAQHGLPWVFDETRDIALGLMPLGPDVDIKAISPENCIDLEDVVPSMQTYTVGCSYGLPGVEAGAATPLVLDGIVSGVDTARSLIYTSAPTFPGNSGGPLIVVRSPFSTGGALHVGRATVLLAGMMRESAFLPGSGDERNNTSHQLPGLHLGVAVSIRGVLDLMTSESAQAQKDRAGVTSRSETS